MSWSKIENKEPKPIGWWYHKIMCEFGWWIRINIHYSYGDKKYYYHAFKLFNKYKRNLYGHKTQ